MPKKKTACSLERWEVALIKAMLDGSGLTKQRILSFFSTPERDVNPARLHDIIAGKLGAGVEPASEAQVRAYLAQRGTGRDLRRVVLEAEPLSAYSLSEAIQVAPSGDRLINPEGVAIEFKEALHWEEKKGRRRVLRTMAAFANTQGGYLLIGIEDGTLAIKGVAAGLDGDAAKITDSLAKAFSPVPLWDHTLIDFGSRLVAVIHVPEAARKPVIAITESDVGDASGIALGDVYWRYPGQTSRIRPGELEQLIREREAQVERRWESLVRNIRSIGVEHVAVLDAKTGRVDGPSGSFLIDESLLPRIAFIHEGRFAEADGAPTLKLVGEVRPISADRIQPVMKEKADLSEYDILSDFSRRIAVPNPVAYLRQIVDMRPLWLPVFWYIRLARLSLAEAAELVRAVPTRAKQKKEDLAARILDLALPPALATKHTEVAVAKLRAREPLVVTTPKQAEIALRALRQLEPAELDIEQHGPLLAEIVEAHFEGSDATLVRAIRCTASWLDYVVYGRALGGATVDSLAAAPA